MELQRVRVLADRKLLNVFSNGAVDEIRLTFGTYLVREDAAPPGGYQSHTTALCRVCVGPEVSALSRL